MQELPGSQLQLDKYLGKWYQFAATPHFYEPAGTHNVTAVYGAGGTVTNSLQYRGKTKTIEGRLSQQTGAAPNVFNVTLEKAIFSFPITASYIVENLYVDDNGVYVAAIVGGKGDSTYVLSRTPAVDCELQAQLQGRLGEKRWNKLNFTPQTC